MKPPQPRVITVRFDAATAQALEAWRCDDDDSTTAEAARKAIRSFLRSKGYLPMLPKAKKHDEALGHGH